MDATAELSRRLESLIRSGTISAVDHGKALCRVHTGQLETDWLPWLESRTGETRSWNPPTVGEQVVLLCPSGDPASGFVLLGLYADAKPAPDSNPATHTVVFPDGARICYDHALGALSATGIKTALVDASNSITAKADKSIHAQAGQSITAEAGDSITLKAGQTITLDAPNTVITGNALVQKLFTFLGGMAGFAGPGGGPTARLSGQMAIDGGGINVQGGDVRADGISLKTHPHIEQGDGKPTSPPQAS